MSFKKGQSGNPKGRPAGTKDKRRELRALLEPHAPALIEKAVQMALKGDTTALRLCLDRLLPPMRAIEHSGFNPDAPVKFILRMGKDLKKDAKALD